eukprot:2943165-Amphidinium_carterae.1
MQKSDVKSCANCSAKSCAYQCPQGKRYFREGFCNLTRHPRATTLHEFVYPADVQDKESVQRKHYRAMSLYSGTKDKYRQI